MHHVTVVNALQSLTAHRFGPGYQCTATTHLQMIGMNAYTRPVTDQPRGAASYTLPDTRMIPSA